MKELDGEGPATHTSPESCVGVREGEGETLTGGRADRVFSRESPLLRSAGPETSGMPGHTSRENRESPWSPGVDDIEPMLSYRLGSPRGSGDLAPAGAASSGGCSRSRGNRGTLRPCRCCRGAGAPWGCAGKDRAKASPRQGASARARSARGKRGENGHRLGYACAADSHHEPRTRCEPQRREHGGAMTR